jgi:hypothetical protein
MRRSLMSLLLLLTGLVTPLTAARAPIVLKDFELPDPRATDANSKANAAVLQAFRKKFPHIALRAFSGIKIENMDLDAGPLMAIAGGVAPDTPLCKLPPSELISKTTFSIPWMNSSPARA